MVKRFIGLATSRSSGPYMVSDQKAVAGGVCPLSKCKDIFCPIKWCPIFVQFAYGITSISIQICPKAYQCYESPHAIVSSIAAHAAPGYIQLFSRLPTLVDISRSCWWTAAGKPLRCLLRTAVKIRRLNFFPAPMPIADNLFKRTLSYFAGGSLTINSFRLLKMSQYPYVQQKAVDWCLCCCQPGFCRFIVYTPFTERVSV